ncbi:helix-turn-helix domain-containing protein [Parasphingorhabdus sp. JC815]|uniref:TetR/AcrR family transcriptional regulator n=1 Tax=Parasphingorhabdus sp. JC815 TaxID=3232140 RepID=UPI003458E8B0
MTAREKILAASRDLIDERSFEAATVGSICRQASVSNGSFFHAFSSKEDRVAELFMETLISYRDP